MMNRIRFASLIAAAGVSVVLAGCLADDKDDGKGIVDDSAPPAPSIMRTGGKADDGGAASNLVTVRVESTHPYRNNTNRIYRVELDALPTCASSARLHFQTLRTELDYDFVYVEPVGAPSQTFTGSRDDTWSAWFPVTASARYTNVRLKTDGSVTRQGFVVDKIEWSGANDSCPQWRVSCPVGTVQVREPAASACACAGEPECLDLEAIEISHSQRRRFLVAGRRVNGTVASTLKTGPADGIEATAIGSIPADRLAEVVQLAAKHGLLWTEGYDLPSDDVIDVLTIKIGDDYHGFAAPVGKHTTEVGEVIAAFEALFACGDEQPLTCGDGFACDAAGACAPEASCFCTEQYDPVCGVNGRTYGNACSAGCAQVEVAHDGECGAVGDMCGGLIGLACADANKCRYDVSTWEARFPDDAGACVADTYCDAASDCTDLPHPMVLGAWSCDANMCGWKAGPQWLAIGGGGFETTHPYDHSTSVGKQLDVPAGGDRLRLVTSGRFELEAGYDFLQVFTWQGGSWKLVKSYSGTAGPAVTDEFVGTTHYVRFVSDSSIAAHGFALQAEWR